MVQRSLQKPSIGFLIAAVVILIGSFLPWAKVPASALAGQGFLVPFSFPGLQLSISVNAWNGYINLMGLELPNWLVVLSAAGIAAMRWGKQSGAWDVADSWLMGLAIYNVIVSIWVFFAAVAGGSVGIGLVVTIGANAWMLVTLFRQMSAIKRQQPLEASAESPQF
ncbi:MAG: hypothetical protein NT013_08030 [Planctomycetia bacterium]|nr:hypothetical protein [Planctomycetia bacterium]